MAERTAEGTVRRDDLARVERYLPDNYRVTHVLDEDGYPDHVRVKLSGEDVGGWTLDAYVIPRLRSGLMEFSET